MKQQTYKVLIADDEYWTREKIRHMIQWEEYGLEFLEPAVDGEDALARISQEQPDILITDINMPFITGVDLIKLVREKYPQIISFVISGYDDFDYVRETLVNGAVNYLLKPVSKIDLVNALSKSMEIISQRQQKENEQQETRTQLLKASSLLLDREFSYFLREKEAAFTPNISMNTSLDIAGNSAMLVKIHDLREIKATYDYDLNLYSYNTKQQIRSYFAGFDVMVFNNTARTNEFLIFSNIEFTQIGKIAERMLNGLNDFANSVITIIINEHSFSVDNIRDVYRQTISLLQFRPFTQESLILTTRQNEPDDAALSKVELFGPQQANDLTHLIENGHKSAVCDWIFRYLNLQDGAGGFTFLAEKCVTKNTIQFLYRCFKNDNSVQDMLDMEDAIENSDSIIDMIDVAGLKEFFAELVDSLMPEKDDCAAITTQDVIENAILYINEHYSEKNSLSDIAYKFGVSSSYFSTMFSRRTGETLMSYITRLRVEKAATLIPSDSIRLTEVAFMVGYDDYAYFSRVFRKIKGLSPREYKNSFTSAKK